MPLEQTYCAIRSSNIGILAHTSYWRTPLPGYEKTLPTTQTVPIQFALPPPGWQQRFARVTGLGALTRAALHFVFAVRCRSHATLFSACVFFPCLVPPHPCPYPVPLTYPLPALCSTIVCTGWFGGSLFFPCCWWALPPCHCCHALFETCVPDLPRLLLNLLPDLFWFHNLYYLQHCLCCALPCHYTHYAHFPTMPATQHFPHCHHSPFPAHMV